MSTHLSSSSSSSASSPSSTTSSKTLPRNDHRISSVIIVLVIFGIVLVGFIIFITVRLKKWRSDEASGPYKGTVVHHEHPAAQITPFGGGGPHSGMIVPQFKHTPGENMRIAFRRPDGAWHFADSRTPFMPTGVNDIDVLPSPTSSSTSLLSLNVKIPSNKEREAMAARDLYKGHDPESVAIPPPPAYHRESCNQHFGRDHSL